MDRTYSRPCKARSPGGRSIPYYCTLDAGHTGTHVAHGYNHRVITAWEDEAAPVLSE